MESVKNAANYVSGTILPYPIQFLALSPTVLTCLRFTDKTSEALNSASKETNKEVAKDSNVSIGNRASAAKDAVGDSLSEVRTSSGTISHR